LNETVHPLSKVTSIEYSLEVVLTFFFLNLNSSVFVSLDIVRFPSGGQIVADGGSNDPYHSAASSRNQKSD
jgi:hypothetical protein